MSRRRDTLRQSSSPTGVQTSSKETVQWVYHGRNREKTLIIEPGAITVTGRKYISYENFQSNLNEILNSAFEEEKDLSAARFGLRYVNLIDLGGNDPLSWREYIREEMLGIIDTHKDQGALSRVFHIVEFNYDSILVKFQFGIPNPDYPALIKRKQFVLDIDAYVHGALTKDDIVNSLETAHEKIQELFESSITDATRKLMKPVTS